MCRVYTDDAVRASCKSTCQSAVDDEQLDKIDRCFGTFSNNNPLPDYNDAEEENDDYFDADPEDDIDFADPEFDGKSEEN